MKLKLAVAGAAAIALSLAGVVSVQATSARAASAQAVRPQAVQSRAGAAAGFVKLGGSPGAPAVNPATHTLYVPVQCTSSFCSGAPAHVVDIINTTRCDVTDLSGCRVTAAAEVGSGPLAVAVDPRTDTVYVMNGTSNTVSVLNGARCNARVTSGCARPVATVKVGQMPVAGAVSPATHTLYVANLNGGISVINTAACDATVTRGCGAKPRTVADTASPSWVDINSKTGTVYVANNGNGTSPGSVSVINGAGCNASTGTGCAKKPVTVPVGVNSVTLAVDQSTNTVYVADAGNGNSGSVSVINGATCNGKLTSGCRVAATVPTGAGTAQVAVDRQLHTVFAINGGDDTLSAINTETCNGTVTASCSRRPLNAVASALAGPGFNSFLNGLALGENGTAYVVNIGGLSVLSVDSTGRCNVTYTGDCRAEAPSVPEPENVFAADAATHTIYAGNQNLPRIDVINGATCNARNRSGCAPVATIPMPDPGANVGAIDKATHTLYAADEAPSGTLAVINIAACNATRTAGCAAPVGRVKLGAFPNPPALNPATHTLYVSYGDSANKIAVVNAATCNATRTAGCGHTPAAVTVGPGTDDLAVSVATNTVYGANSGSNNFNGDTVSVLNGATCDAANTSGCGHLAATAKVGRGPFGIVVNDATHTVYVANNANGDAPGTVSVINAAACDGTHTAGCHASFPVMPAGKAPLLAALDPATGLLYVADFASAAVTVLNTARCNAKVTSGCGQPGRQRAVGSNPVGIVVTAGSVYVGQLYRPGSMAIFGA